jgi:ABC-type sugar transport system substrate-binding protein
VLTVIFGGCGGESFAPPRPPELAGAEAGATTGARPRAGATTPTAGEPSTSASAIELVVGPRDEIASEMLKSHARSQAGLERARIQIAIQGEKGDQATEAELVRKALARNPLALVLEPSDPADRELRKAVDDARGQGVPVVLLGRPLGAAASAEPTARQNASAGASSAGVGQLVVVVPDPFAVAAESLVSASMNNARNAKLSPQSGGIVALNPASDPLVEERVRAFRDALTKAGVTAVEELRLGSDSTVDKQQVAEFLKANPKPSMVLAADQRALTAIYGVLSELGETRPYVVAGFSADESGARMVAGGEFAALAVFAPERLLRKAIVTAAAVGRGEKQPERVLLIVPIHISPAKSALAKMHRMMEQTKKGASKDRMKKAE